MLLGSSSLFVLPPECGTTYTNLLPPRSSATFVHPDAVVALGPLVKQVAFRQMLGLRLYTLKVGVLGVGV